LEWRKTKAEHKAKAMRRIKLTAARPWLGTNLPPSGRVAALGAVSASMQEAMLEGPVWGEIHPAVVLIFPAVVTEAADPRSGKNR
jgi:hypothetical protein